MHAVDYQQDAKMSDFDFGFTAVTLDELDFIQQQRADVDTATVELEALESKLLELRAAIQPLLNNLKKDPAKNYIYWEDRLPKITQFEQHLDKIINK